MAMMITRFHRLIQSRLLWGFFLVIIVFSFVIWGTMTPGQARKAREENAAGTLFGEHIAPDEFQAAYRSAYLGLVLSTGRELNMNDRLSGLLREETWKRLAALKTAEKMGLTTAEREVVDAVKQQPVFLENGQFSANRYRMFVERMLQPGGFTEALFERHLREEITLQKLRRMTDQAVLIPPLDAARAYRAVTDRFRLDYVTLGEDLVAASVTVTPAQVAAHFQANTERYTRPAQVRVSCVTFPAADQTARIPAPAAADVEAYYNENMARFTTERLVTVTNDPAPGETTAATVTTRVERVIADFDEMRNQIEAEMIRLAALDKAREAAYALIDLIAPSRRGPGKPFAEAVAELGLTTAAIGPFARTNTLPEWDGGREIVRAAFELRRTEDEYFSDALAGSNTVYVLALEERIPERAPELAEVEAEVAADARAAAVRVALDRFAGETAAALRAAAAAGKSFADAARAAGLKAETTTEFDAMSGAPDFPHFSAVMQSLLPYEQGNVTDQLALPDGQFLIAQIALRQASTNVSLDEYRPQIVSALRRERGRQMFESWQEDILRQAGFTAKNLKTDEADTPDAEDAETAPEDTVEP